MGVAGIDYDASAGIMATALRFTSTIIPLVVRGSEFWILLFLNVGICTSRHMDLFNPAEYNMDLPWGLTGVTGSLMTFFVCFYNQHVFGRYNKLYTLTKTMSEHCIELVSILRVQVRDVSARRRIAKLVIASCIMFFFERTESVDEGKVSDREFEQLQTLDLLGDYEVRHLKSHCRKMDDAALPSFLVLQWAMQLMRRETPEPESRDDMLIGFYSRVYNVRKCQAEVVQILDLPMPFQYFHIMNLMLMLNLLLWAYSLACEDSFFAPLIYMFVQMMFQGIRELSTALSDPFGNDEVDFPVNEWMMSLYARMYGILEDKHDVKSFDLTSVEPMMPPKQALGIINMYCDLLEEPAADYARSNGSNGYQRVRTDEELTEDEV